MVAVSLLRVNSHSLSLPVETLYTLTSQASVLRSRRIMCSPSGNRSAMRANDKAGFDTPASVTMPTV